MVKFKAGDRICVAFIDRGDPKWIEPGMCGTVLQSKSEAPWVKFDSYLGTEKVDADKEHIPGWKAGHMECLTQRQLRGINGTSTSRQ